MSTNDRDDPLIDHPGAPLTLGLHGYPRIEAGGRRQRFALRRGLALLARLAAARDPVPRAVVAAQLWAGADAALARTRLRRLVHETNRRLPVPLVEGDADTLWLATGRVSCDWLQARALARSVLRGAPVAPHEAWALLRRDAHQLLEGFSLGSAAYDEWLDATRRDHEALTAQALERVAVHWLDAGAPAAARAAAQRLVALDPCAEAGYACLIAAHGQLGDATAVEGAYFACADTLRRELGIKPSALVEAAYAGAVQRCARARGEVLARLLARCAALVQADSEGRERVTVSASSRDPA